METKICVKCKVNKILGDFYFRKDIQKYRNECKKCCLKYLKQKHKKYPWKQILRNIKSRCENPKNKSFKDYGGRGIKCLMTEEEVKFLWFRDKAYKMIKPSIDRKDNDGHYEFDNCRFIEMNKNRTKDRTKSILQYDLQGNFIKEWESGAEIEKTINISASNIYACCREEINTAYQYKWKYKYEKEIVNTP